MVYISTFFVHSYNCLGRWSDDHPVGCKKRKNKAKMQIKCATKYTHTHRSNLLHTIHTEGELSTMVVRAETTTLHHQPAELNGDCIKYSYRRRKSAAERKRTGQCTWVNFNRYIFHLFHALLPQVLCLYTFFDAFDYSPFVLWNSIIEVL